MYYLYIYIARIMKNQIDWEVGNNLKDIKAIYKMIGNRKIIYKNILWFWANSHKCTVEINMELK